MNPYEAVLRSTDTSGPSRTGSTTVRGALICARLDLVPDANIGDVLLIDSGVAVAVLSTEPKKPSEESQRTIHHVPGHSR
ncbi:MAG: HypC/HybG/HupF family hydrogenase formation chaperone [Bacteroidetes bacterium]|jgi:hydrogenase maturation factor|nr:HypC/HybG/HupF family hydrogenase formation chaperone [Bacteroidota bacterium]